MRCCVAEDYVAMCTACKKAVDRKDLHYVNGLSYHTACSLKVALIEVPFAHGPIITLKNLNPVITMLELSQEKNKKKG